MMAVKVFLDPCASCLANFKSGSSSLIVVCIRQIIFVMHVLKGFSYFMMKEKGIFLGPQDG